MNRRSLFVFWFALAGYCVLDVASGDEESGEVRIVLADGAFGLKAPAAWKMKKPRSRIVAYEFGLPAAKGDSVDGRLTIMAAGGSIEANVDRWIGQFVQSDGTATKNRAKTNQKEIAGQKVHFVDVAGTFQDRPRGPFGPAVARENYRMFGAIIELKDKGNYFVKLYGPHKTVSAAEKPFQEFIESLQAVQ
jgi:hypothetical protein